MPLILEQTAGFGWSAGEIAVQRLLGVPPQENPTPRGLPRQFAARVQAAPLVAVGTLDSQGRPWTSLWAGPPGFVHRIAENVVGMQARVDGTYDPVVEALVSGGNNRPMSALAIDLEARDRVKLAGTMMAAGGPDAAGVVRLAMAVAESIGNCPKYINKKTLQQEGETSPPQLASDTLPLSPAALTLLDRADMFFMTTTDPNGTMDTNHRGGSSGLLRVSSNSDQPVLVFPEFSGNRFYSSLGNLHTDGRVGLVVPDYETGDVLYLTGTASLLVGPEAAAVLQRTRLAVRIVVSAARLVRAGLRFRAAPGEPSPYTPPPRRLASETSGDPPARRAIATAVLRAREPLTPTVARYTFALRPAPAPWTAAQHVTLDFAPELDPGYSHMRDDDPQSLNDDLARTFTVSSPPPLAAAAAADEMQITVRRRGPATALLDRWNPRAPLELPVLGFGGGALALPRAAPAVFVATGVGVTPLLGQAAAAAAATRLAVVWGLRADDAPLAADALRRAPALAAATTLCITGPAADEALRPLHDAAAAATVRRGRITRPVLVAAAAAVTAADGVEKPRFLVCASPAAAKEIAGWLEDEYTVVTESFAY